MTDISKFKALIKANSKETPLTTMPLSLERQEALNRHIQDKQLLSNKGATPITKL